MLTSEMEAGQRLGVATVITLQWDLCLKPCGWKRLPICGTTLDLAQKLPLAPLPFTHLPVSGANWRQRQELVAALLAGIYGCRLLLC